MDAVVRERPMARKKVEPRMTSVRLTEESLRWVRIASGHSGESITEYVNRRLNEAAKEDAERFAQQLLANRESTSSKPKAKK